MDYKNFFKWLEITYRIDINKNLQNILEEHFGDNLNIYTEQDLYEQSRKIIQTYKENFLQYNKYKRYYSEDQKLIKKNTINRQIS